MDKRTFGQLVMENEIQLYRIAKSILKSDEDCADAAQEAVMKAFEKLDTLREDKYAKTWLIRILIHVCYDFASKKKSQNELSQQWCGVGQEKEDYSELYEGLHMLEQEFRVVLVLHYLEGYQVQEIAEMLGIPEGTVKSRMSRGRNKMKTILSDGKLIKNAKKEAQEKRNVENAKIKNALFLNESIGLDKKRYEKGE